MKDIETRQDLGILLKEFYNRLLQDPAIGYIFTDIAEIDLEHHLPILTDFWEMSLFHTGSYRNNTMQVHLELNAKEKLTKEYFDIWLKHFNETANDLFVGPNTEKLRTRALSIATVMQIKLAEE